MRLNQANLRQTLAAVLGVDQSYVVPTQGNVFNPQAGEPNPARPRTWCGFRIEASRTVTVPHWVPDSTPKNWSVVHKRTPIRLQFVGDLAEDLANSVAHWPHYSAVQEAFAAYDGKLFVDDGHVTVTDFDQSGGNTVLAYNVGIEVLWADEIDSKQEQITGMTFVAPVVTVP